MTRWTEEEIDILRDVYPEEGGKVCAELLWRSKHSVYAKAKLLGLSSYRGSEYTKPQDIYELELIKLGFEALEPYINAKTKTKIKHRHISCGYEWYSIPPNIRKISSCPNCVHESSNILHFIYFPSLDLYKVGITNNLGRRRSEFGVYSIVITSEALDNAYEEEQKLLKKLSKYLTNTMALISGNTETFRWPS